MDVVIGVEEKKVVLLWDELEGCEGWNSNCVALKRFEIKDVVLAFGDAESISTLAALEGAVAEVGCYADGVSVLLSTDEIVVNSSNASEVNSGSTDDCGSGCAGALNGCKGQG